MNFDLEDIQAASDLVLDLKTPDHQLDEYLVKLMTAVYATGLARGMEMALEEAKDE